MNFYICSTPYHVFVSITHLLTSGQKGIMYLTTHDPTSYKLFLSIEPKLKNISGVDKVIIRKRNLFLERLRLEELKDWKEYRTLKADLNQSAVYLFPWNPYAIYTIANSLYKKANMVNLVEDGSNVYAYPHPGKKSLWIKKQLYGVSVDFVKDAKLEQILVQYPDKYPAHLQDKIAYLDLENLYTRLTDTQKADIVNIFINKEEVSELLALDSENSIIILTQPLSEDGFCTETEKLNLYQEIVEQYFQDYQIIIKKHPRETTQYQFHDVTELAGYFPSETFPMLSIRFKKAIGICTSAIHSIDAEERLNIDENFFEKGKQQ